MEMAKIAYSEDSELPTGRVFNIQRCSVHDGPGIRTTVFLKGCPLSCSWCHNPEGIEVTAVLMLNADRCLACRACSEVCPVEEGGAAPAGEVWNRGACTLCGSCVEVCPADARNLAGRPYGVHELVDVLERDRVFFDASGGGVTFSGGEPLLQPEFLKGCLEDCRERGIHTAVDTCGLAPREEVLEIAGLADLVLYDVKHPDPERHRVETGADNALILDNLAAVSELGVELWIRIPLVPGFNDQPESIEATGSLLEQLPRRHPVFILPYHAIGDGKRSRLEEGAGRTAVEPPSEDILGAVAERLAKHDLEVTVGG